MIWFAAHHVLINAVIHAVNWYSIRLLHEWSSACSKCSLLQEIVCVLCVTDVSVHMPCRCCQLVQWYFATFCSVARSKEKIWRWWCVRHGFLVTQFFTILLRSIYTRVTHPIIRCLCYWNYTLGCMYDDISYLFEDCCKLRWTWFITHVRKSLLVVL